MRLLNWLTKLYSGLKQKHETDLASKDKTIYKVRLYLRHNYSETWISNEFDNAEIACKWINKQLVDFGLPLGYKIEDVLMGGSYSCVYSRIVIDKECV